MSVIGVTMGDPAGVGPEIVLKAARRLSTKRGLRLIVFGDRSHLSFVQKKVFAKNVLPNVDVVDFRNVSSLSFRFGHATAANGKASGDYIAAAVRAAQNKFIDALVTSPINKVAFKMGGWGKRFVGHTEMLASLTKTKNYALMLAHGNLRAIHVTSHIPLRRVPQALSVARIAETIKLAHLGLRQLGFRRPKIAVCGLNPHAGDEGLVGNEEKRLIRPAVQKARRSGLIVEGPLSPDTVWPMVLSKKYDIGVAMYHDQGQIPVKLMGFQNSAIVRGVNITVGLPIIRTSVAHGTAYEIAGKGLASEESLIDAIHLADQMVRNK